ncbi:MAG: hypothetical protein PHN74_00500 [Candidatus Pacebacteria bacterium]|nr:hypothetical protein [Candidatus Paceibacterota bacterium]
MKINVFIQEFRDITNSLEKHIIKTFKQAKNSRGLLAIQSIHTSTNLLLGHIESFKDVFSDVVSKKTICNHELRRVMSGIESMRERSCGWENLTRTVFFGDDLQVVLDFSVKLKKTIGKIILNNNPTSDDLRYLIRWTGIVDEACELLLQKRNSYEDLTCIIGLGSEDMKLSAFGKLARQIRGRKDLKVAIKMAGPKIVNAVVYDMSKNGSRRKAARIKEIQDVEYNNKEYDTW